jgi:CYTH domain-containing protein
MKSDRTFLVSPAIVRLLQRERSVSRDIVEGYLSRTADRVQLVRIEPDGCALLLHSIDEEGTRTEDRSRISGAQAKAIMDVCKGRIMYSRKLQRIGAGLDINLDRFEGLDLISMQFDDADTAASFIAPVWFGPEVTTDPQFERASFALNGMPKTPEAPVTNESIIAFLDAVAVTNGIASPAPGPLRSDEHGPAEVSPADSEATDGAAEVEREERISEVLAGLSDALTTSDETKLAPFLVPFASRRARR